MAIYCTIAADGQKQYFYRSFFLIRILSVDIWMISECTYVRIYGSLRRST